MKDPLVRTHPLTMRTSRLVVMVVFAALLSALPFHAALAATEPNLGTAGSFALLGGQAVSYTNSHVIGDVGSPVAVTPVSSTVVGTVYLPGDPIWSSPPTPFDDFLAAYVALRPSPPPEQWPCGLVSLNSVYTTTTLTLPPGVYCSIAGVTFTDTTLTLDGTSADTWIFKIGSETGALTGTKFNVVMSSGETCNKNVFWWTAEGASLTDSVFIGSILAGTAITVTNTAIPGGLQGQALARTAVTLTDTNVSVCGGGPPGPPPHCGIKVTGGGQIPVPAPNSKGRATFGFNAQPDKKGDTAKGHFNYVNHVTGLHVNGPVDKLVVIATNPDGSPKTVQFSGTCQHGPKCSFIVTVEDHGEPGRNDQFGITVTGKLTEVTSQRVISNGNIQFHDKSCEDNEDNNPCGDNGNHGNH